MASTIKKPTVESKIYLGVDTGGTFTDFVLVRDQQLQIHKVLSTPHAPEEAILKGIDDLGLAKNLTQALLIIHGSTVATNAVLEAKGVRTVFITNRGHADMLTIGRQARRELYNLQPPLILPPVPKALCIETGGRIGSHGEVVEDLTLHELKQLREQLIELAPQAVAINLLFSFLDENFEKQIAAIVPSGVFVSRSSNVLPEIKEYERGIATWLNASVGPLVDGYIRRLYGALPENPKAKTTLSVMQSSGGTVEATLAADQAVQLLLSGPAGGLAGAKYVAGCSGCDRLLTFDMGGTSTDVALIEGDLKLTNEGSIGPYPIAVPMVDLHTIGAGGGSIAFVDAGGLLQVGPESAGANPGPACYANGGDRATVTDANLILNRLPADTFLGGEITLDYHAANKAISTLANLLSLDIVATAQGIIRIANEHMARALRLMSVQRGIDPQELILVSFGGAGGLHVCALANALKMQRALVPIHAGVLSALGMLIAPRQRHLSRSFNSPLAKLSLVELKRRFDELILSGTQSLEEEGVDEQDIFVVKSVDLRYTGQSYALNIEWLGIDKSSELFHEAHMLRYGHKLDLPIELVTVRVKLRGRENRISLKPRIIKNNLDKGDKKNNARHRENKQKLSMIDRAEMNPLQVYKGPLLIIDAVSTTWLESQWQCVKDEIGNLMLERRNLPS